MTVRPQQPTTAAAESRGITSGIAIFLGEYVQAERQAQALGLTPTQSQKNKALDLMVFQGGSPTRISASFTRASQAWW